jgi:hypothetical protein
MDTTRMRTGAATSPDRRQDRASIDARLRALTIAAAVAGAAGVTGFGFLAAQGTTTAATAATEAIVTTGSTGSTATSETTAATAAPVLQATPGAVAAGSGPGQVTTGGS